MSEQRKRETIAETTSASEPIKFESAVPRIRSVSRSGGTRPSERDGTWTPRHDRRNRCALYMRVHTHYIRIRESDCTLCTRLRCPPPPRSRSGVAVSRCHAGYTRVHLIVTATGHTSCSYVHFTCAKIRDSLSTLRLVYTPPP